MAKSQNVRQGDDSRKHSITLVLRVKHNRRNVGLVCYDVCGRRVNMAMDRARIAQMEKALEEARAQLWKEEAERLRILMREISKEEKERIMESLTDRQERVLFGLEQPDAASRGSIGPGKSGGDLVCPHCGKSNLTKRGLGLHIARLHKDEKTEEEEPQTSARR